MLNKSKSRETFDRSKYSANNKKGISMLNQNSNIIFPSKLTFRCKLGFFEDLPNELNISAVSTSDCKIKGEVYQQTKEVHRLISGNINVPLSELNYGFIDSKSAELIFKDSRDNAIKDLLQLLSTLTKGQTIAIVTDKADNYRFKYLYFKSEDSDYNTWVEYLNNLIAINLTYTRDYNLLPKLYTNTIKIDYIKDYTKVSSDEAYFKDYFSENWVLVKDSLNCTIDTSESLPLLKNYLYDNNQSISYSLDLHTQGYGGLIDSNQENSESINFKKIYQCSIWHNVLPFAANPGDNLSYCGIGFGLGARDEFVETNSAMLFIKDMPDYLCIMHARALQRHITSQCADGSDELYEKCFVKLDEEDKKEESKDDKNNSNQYTGEDGNSSSNKNKDNYDNNETSSPEDTSTKKQSTISSNSNNSSNNNQNSEVSGEPMNVDNMIATMASEPSANINIHNHAHGPSGFVSKEIAEVLYALILNVPQIDPKIFYENASYNHKFKQQKDNKIYPLIDPYPFLIKFEPHAPENIESLFIDQLNNQEDYIKQKNKSISESESIESEINNKIDNKLINKKVSSEIIQSNEVNSVNNHANKIKVITKIFNLNISNNSIKTKFYCSLIKNINDFDIIGRGKNLKNYQKIYLKIMQQCLNIGINNKNNNYIPVKSKYSDNYYLSNNVDVDSTILSEKCDQKTPGQLMNSLPPPTYWTTVKKNGKKTQKSFNTHGKPNGDILEYQKGCCVTFSSNNANIIVEWCQGKMRYKKKGAEWEYEDIYGNVVNKSEFSESCLSDAAVKKLEAEMKRQPLPIVTFPGGIEILDKDKSKTTTIKSDGNILNKDSHSETKDSVKEMEKYNNIDGLVDQKDSFSIDHDHHDIKDNINSKDHINSKDNIKDNNYNKDSSKDTIESKNKANEDEIDEVNSSTNTDDNQSNDDKNLNDESKRRNAHNFLNHDTLSNNNPKLKSTQEIDSIRKSIGHYDIYIDKEDKVTVLTKQGTPYKLEKIVDAYRSGDIVWIKFENGDKLKHYLSSGETVRIYNDRNTVAHLYPDNSISVDNRELQVRQLNNKYNIAADYDIKNNKILDKRVKKHFRYNNDTVYVLENGEVMIRKQDGSVAIVDNQDNVTTLDKDNNVLTQTNGYRFYMDLKNKYIADRKTGFSFKMRGRVSLEDDRLVEYNKRNSWLLNEDGAKELTTSKYKSACYPNGFGYKYNRHSMQVFKCKCNHDTIINWTCTPGYKLYWVKKLLQKQNKKKSDNFIQDKWNNDIQMLKNVRDEFNEE